MNVRSLIFPILSITLAASCIQQQENTKKTTGDETQVVIGNFGHLPTVSQHKASPLFLSTLPKGQTYNICLSERMVNKFPGIKEEIEASINIWAHYIERKIPVSIKVKNLPFPSSGWDIEDFTEVYKQMCGSDVDLFMAEDHPDGKRLGYTQQTRTYYAAPAGEQTTISSFSRILNLTSWPSSENKKFVSLEQLTGKTRTTNEILDLLVNRNKTIYMTEEGRHLTLTTLVHEFGHVWGLCDQYPLDNNQTNCDPLHSTLSPQGHIILNDDAVMSSSGWIHELGLHDDDIEGIIDLAERSDLATTGWSLPTKNLSDFPARVQAQGPVRLMKVKSAKMESNGTLNIISALDIDGNANIILQMKFVGSETWRNQGPQFEFSKDVQTNNMTLQLRANYSKPIEKLRLIYTKRTDAHLIDEALLSDAVISDEINVVR